MPRKASPLWGGSALLVVASCLWSVPSWGDPWPFPPFHQRLRRQLLGAPLDVRRATLGRLGNLGSGDALQVLLDYARPGTIAAQRREPSEWLALTRALAPHARLRAPRDWLLQFLQGGVSGVAEELDTEQVIDWARGSAAMALAASGDGDSVLGLAQLIQQSGLAASLAQQALLAHPIREPEGVLGIASRRPTLRWVAVVESMEGEAAHRALRHMARTARAAVRARAAVALFRRGDPEVGLLAEQWAGHERAPLRRASVQILMSRDAASGARLLAEELRRAPRDPELWRWARSAAFQPELLEVVQQAASEGWLPAWQVLPQWAEQVPSAWLLEQSSRFPHRVARVLASLSQDAFRRFSESPGIAPREPPWLLRAAQVLALRSSRRAALLPASEEPELRYLRAQQVGWWEPPGLRRALESEEPLELGAVASSVLVWDAEEVRHAAHVLARTDRPELKERLAVCLLRAEGRAALSTTTLLRLVRAGDGVARVLSLRALAERDDPQARSTTRWYQQQGSRRARAHIARGLASLPASVAGWDLLEVLQWEPAPEVREAAGWALAQRREPLLARELSLLVALEPEPAVREAVWGSSRDAHEGENELSRVLWHDEPAEGSEPIWVRLHTGEELPVFPAPSGQILVVGARPNVVIEKGPGGG